MNNLDVPVIRFPGIGAKRAELFERLGITTPRDLLTHYPRGYQNRGNTLLVADAPNGEVNAFILTVGTRPQGARLKNRMTVTKFFAFDESGKCTVVFFNQNYVMDIFTVGATFRFWGKLNRGKGGIELLSPQFEPVIEGATLPDFTPLYPLTAGLSQKIIYNAVGIALEYFRSSPTDEPIPASLRARRGLISRAEAYVMIHRPRSTDEIDAARKYLTYEELFLFAMNSLSAKAQRNRGAGPHMSRVNLSPFNEALGFELTGAQKRSITEIEEDICSEPGTCDKPPMLRMLSGDVGSGKTAVAAAAAYIAAKNGYQTVIMAPTEILAAQHFNDLSQLFMKLGIACTLLTGSMTPSKKAAARAAIAAHGTDIVIGTHALLSETVTFARAGLVITDEQHRFGAAQRTALASRASSDGSVCNVLIMSATPIPRTLTMILYGDMDLSVLDELPTGRIPVDTFTVNESYRNRINAFIAKQVKEGGQVYIVCPSIEPRDFGEDIYNSGEIISFDYGYDAETVAAAPDIKSAVTYAEHLQNDIFPELRVSFLHGKLPAAEKDRIMRAFVKGDIDILVSTTVIEVGVNVPNASLMIIENAEYFGLAQLHQLRGRVGRGSRKSYCILISDSKSEITHQRLNAIRDDRDGFKIAEKDLAIRGPGDYIADRDGSARQHGAFKLKMGGMCPDTALLNEAFSDAAEYAASESI